MPVYEHDQAEIYYEEYGSGFPVLLLAPGGMKSAIAYWETTPWNPIEQLSSEYRVIAMDQRNAGRSTAPVSAAVDWSTYAGDQLGLMDYLGIDRFHAVGMCIGGPFALGLIKRAPTKVVSAVLFQPIGRDGNRDMFFTMFDEWAEPLKSERDAGEAAWQSFRDNMVGGDDVLFDVDEAFLSACTTPLMVLEGNDAYHPRSTSRLIAEAALDVVYVEGWKEEPGLTPARERVATFLANHTPDRIKGALA